MPRGLQPQDFTRNRRSEPRFSSARIVDILPCVAPADWKFLPAELVDCSMHGLGLLVALPMKPGERFLVKLTLARKVKLLLYTVQHCSMSSQSRYCVGARFTGFATAQAEEDLQEIFDALVRLPS